jgi:hypothetical protein
MKLSVGTAAIVLISQAQAVSAFIHGGGPSQALPTLPNFARTFTKFGAYAPSQQEFESNYVFKEYKTAEGEDRRGISLQSINTTDGKNMHKLFWEKYFNNAGAEKVRFINIDG